MGNKQRIISLIMCVIMFIGNLPIDMVYATNIVRDDGVVGTDSEVIEPGTDSEIVEEPSEVGVDIELELSDTIANIGDIIVVTVNAERIDEGTESVHIDLEGKAMVLESWDSDESWEGKKEIIRYEYEVLEEDMGSEIEFSVKVGEERVVTAVLTVLEAECKCSLRLDLEGNIEEYEGDENGLLDFDIEGVNYVVGYDNSTCLLHKEDATPSITIDLKDLNPSTVTVVKQGTVYKISNIKNDTTAKVVIKATIVNGDYTDEKEVSYNINIKSNYFEIGVPKIQIKSYDSETSKLVVNIDPNGSQKVRLYVGGEDKGEIEFNKVDYRYEAKDVEVEYGDIQVPSAVSNIRINRSTSGEKKILVEWDGGEDIDKYIKVYARNSKGKSIEEKVNIISKTNKIIELYNSTTDGKVVLGRYTSTTNSVEIPFEDAKWRSKVAIKVQDISEHKMESSEKVAPIPDDVIHIVTIVDDYIEVQEGSSWTINPKSNDVLDPWYDEPDLSSADIIEGVGQTRLIDIGGIHEVGGVGLAVVYTGVDGNIEDAVIRYTYDKVEPSVPADTGIIRVKIIKRNQEPVAVDDGTEVTDYLNAESGLLSTLPASKLLANDIDRESSPSELRIYNIGYCYNGIVNLSEDRNTISIYPNIGFHGELTFKYTVMDPSGAISRNYATVRVNVKEKPRAPIAKVTDYIISLGRLNETWVISPDVENPDNEEYKINGIDLGNLVVKKDGYELSPSKYTCTFQQSYDNVVGYSTPKVYLRFNVDDTEFKESDTLTIDYKVSNRIGESSSIINISFVNGDDPNDMEGYLYVHRKPTAFFSPKIRTQFGNIESVEINSARESSFDIDHSKSHDVIYSFDVPTYSNKGVRTWEWSVKEATDTNWSTRTFDAEDGNYDGLTGKGAKASAARNDGINWIQNEINSLLSRWNGKQKSYVISLRVRDIDGPDKVGAWSDPQRVLISGIEMPPIALFYLDKSIYTVPAKTNETFNIQVTDGSYDANGDEITYWEWELDSPDGSTPTKWSYSSYSYSNQAISYSLSSYIRNKIGTITYSEEPKFKLTLRVTDSTGLESEPYSVTFYVYKQNETPDIETGDSDLIENSMAASSFLYEIDDGEDAPNGDPGYVGDDWGTLGNTEHPGEIDFSRLINITDDQPVSQLKMTYLFERQRVYSRTDYNEDNPAILSKYYDNLYYPTPPFTDTVTDQGFLPGAYKLSITATDNPVGSQYAPNSAETGYWQTYSAKTPYHLYVVPKLGIYPHTKCNGWIDQQYREEDHATLEEAGLDLSDIAPTIGDTVEIYAYTDEYVTSMWAYNDVNYDGVYTEGLDMILWLNRGEIAEDGMTLWTGSYYIEDIPDAPEGSDYTDLKFVFMGETKWGSVNLTQTTRTKNRPLTIKVLPVKLYDFRVTDVTDTDAYQSFMEHKYRIANKLKLANGSVMDGVPVGCLAVDYQSINPILRKGYSFYFKLCSKGLKRDTDDIRIIPKFYAINKTDTDTIQIGTELYGYVPNSSGVYKIYTMNASDEINKMYALYYEGTREHSLNTHEEIIIKSDLRKINGSEQEWSGRYGIPAEAKFFPAGSTATKANEWTGDILIAFNIQAYKKDRARYDYVRRGQWAKERGSITEDIIREIHNNNKTNENIYMVKEAEWKNSSIFFGTVLVYNGNSSIKDDYIGVPVWSE